MRALDDLTRLIGEALKFLAAGAMISYDCLMVFSVFLCVCFTDCPKVLTLYGMSNLVSESEHSLDLMDPYQRDAKTIGNARQM